MVENKSSLFGIIAIIIGASGLGIGAYSIVNYQLVEGPQGLPGDDGQDGTDGTDGQDGTDGTDGQDGTDGTDGQDAPGGLLVGILDPDDNEIVSGNVTIRALIYGSYGFTVSVLRNGSEIGNILPLVWDTTLELKGWYNITVIITDIQSLNSSSDEVTVFVDNSPDYGDHNTWYLFESQDTSFIPVFGIYQTVFTASFMMSIHVESGEYVHLTFSCEVLASIDMIILYRFFREPDIAMGRSVRIQHAASTYESIYIERVINLSPGDYNIDLHVQLWTGTSDTITYSDKTLMAHTFIPWTPT